MAAYEALTECHRCSAKYDGGGWVRGDHTRWAKTVPGGFVASGGVVKPGHCPFCNAPPQIEPARRVRPM